MSNSAGFAISVPDGFAKSQLRVIDLNAVHRFWFGRKLWLSAVSKFLQGSFLVAAGVFLLAQISTTPKLAAQIALTGGLMTVGGLVMYYFLLAGLISRMTVDSKGLRLRLGWTSVSVAWAQVERWDFSERRQAMPQMPGVTIWVKQRPRPLVIPDGHLSDETRGDIYQLLHAFAYGKQAA
jgi:hypothetical protein